MRASIVFAMLCLVAGCTPYIPVKPGFGVSAVAPAGDIPPEFAEFNNYDPGIHGLLAAQMCATPSQPLEVQSRGGLPGEMVHARWRCANHVPLFGP